MKQFFRLLALSTISFAPISFAATITSLNDGFEGETPTSSQTNFSSFQNWDVSAGTVDLINGDNNPWGLTCNSGSWCVDLDGSSKEAGTLTTKETFAAGTYNISFAISGNQRNADSDTVNYGFDTSTSNDEDVIAISAFSFGTSDGLLDLSLNGNQGWQTISTIMTISESQKFVFQHLGKDNIGLLLDDVSISAVPLPAAVWLFGSGLMGFMALRRRSKAQIA